MDNQSLYFTIYLSCLIPWRHGCQTPNMGSVWWCLPCPGTWRGWRTCSTSTWSGEKTNQQEHFVRWCKFEKMTSTESYMLWWCSQQSGQMKIEPDFEAVRKPPLDSDTFSTCHVLNWFIIFSICNLISFTCRFVGACIDPGQTFLITEYCPRGSLQVSTYQYFNI